MSKEISTIEDHMTKEQLILLFVSGKKPGEKTTLEELQNKFNISKSTAHDIVSRLERQGFLNTDRDDRKIAYFFPKPEYYEKFSKALAELQSAYTYALNQIRTDLQKELKSKRSE